MWPTMWPPRGASGLRERVGFRLHLSSRTARRCLVAELQQRVHVRVSLLAVRQRPRPTNSAPEVGRQRVHDEQAIGCSLASSNAFSASSIWWCE